MLLNEMGIQWVILRGMAQFAFILNELFWLVYCSQFTESSVEAGDICIGSEVIQVGDEDGSGHGGGRIDS